MNISSSAFKHNSSIPRKYTCDGENISPPLSFEGIPSKTQSVVLIMDDPDAPAGTWVHWLVWNIPRNALQVDEKSVPEGAVEGMTSFGASKYGGPCPHEGEHHYFFKAYALDTELELPKSATKEALEEVMIGHVLDKAELVGLYMRKQ